MTKAKKTKKPKRPKRPKTRRQEIVEAFGINRKTLCRYEKKPDFPGLDATDKVLRDWIEGNKSGSGRQSDGKGSPSDGGAMYELRILKLKTEIEEKDAKAGKHLEKAMADYREKTTKLFNSALDIIFREVRRMDLDRDQLERLDAAARDALTRITGGDK